MFFVRAQDNILAHVDSHSLTQVIFGVCMGQSSRWTGSCSAETGRRGGKKKTRSFQRLTGDVEKSRKEGERRQAGVGMTLDGMGSEGPWRSDV